MFVNRRDVLGLMAATAGAGVLGISRAAGDAHLTLPVGMNLAAFPDWAIGYPFRNLMWGARIWLTQALSGHGAWDTGLTGTLAFDDDGYPLQMPFQPAAGQPAQCVATLLPNVLTGGRYVILYDGDGDIGAIGATQVLKTEPGRVEIMMRHKASEVEGITIRRSNRANHVRNIRILSLQDEHADLARDPFRKDFLDFCRPWKCLRFMDWLGTNGSIERSWSARKRRSFYTQLGISGDAIGMTETPLPAWQLKWGSGACIELCLELANLLERDAWICIPHLADDDYIVQAARLVKERLDPRLKVYLEFSNEIWNQGFAQSQWISRSELAAEQVTLAGGPLPWNGGRQPKFANGIAVAGSAEGTQQPARVGALFRRCFKLWEDVFTGDDRKRLVRVCAVQADWLETAADTLAWVMTHGGCDALAPAGYFAADQNVYARWKAAGASLTADEVIADMRPMLAQAAQRAIANAKLARQAAVRFITYEGGQHIVPQDQQDTPYNPALGAAQMHPEMYDLVRGNLDTFAREGCDLFCAYSSVGAQGSQWGSWGHAERYGQNPADMPKYRAVLEANSTPASR